VIGETVGAENLALAGAGLTDTTRLAASPPEIWRDICSTNADAIGPALDALIDVLQRLRSDLPAGDVLSDVFGRARQWRSTLDQV
jgi:prephenate dehydrogenase